MKKQLQTFSVLFMFTAFISAYAQTGEDAYKLGDVNDFVVNFINKGVQSRKAMSLQLSPAKSIDVKIIDDQSEGQDIRVYGEVLGVKTSIFYIYGNASEVKGKIVIDSKDGYVLSTDMQTKEVLVAKADINKLICVMPATNTGSVETETDLKKENGRTSAQPSLSSYPSAPFVLYLDFDGENVNDPYWNSQMGGAKNCTGPNYSDAMIKNIWAAVAEKYRPWNVNVTTDRSVFDSKTKAMRHMVIYTNTWGSGGGIADIGSIADNGTDICWVFFNHLVNNVNDMTVTAAHESGHAFGLEHDGSTADGNYFKGQGNWGPIMGNNYQTTSRDIWQWSKGEYNGATHHAGAPNFQDDVAIIAGNPGVGYRTDDHGNAISSATAILAETDGTVMGTKNTGIITTRTDKDYFKFTTAGGTVTFKFQSGTKTWTEDEGVLDIQARLLDANGAELALSNPTGGTTATNNGLDANISKNVAAGTYYLEVDGVGYLDPKTTGYSDYSSCGYYEISGSYPPVLTGINDGPQAASDFFLYINASNHKLYVVFSDPAVQVSGVQITDALGRIICTLQQSSLQNGIDISDLKAGIYFLQCTEEKTKVISVKKFMR